MAKKGKRKPPGKRSSVASIPKGVGKEILKQKRIQEKIDRALGRESNGKFAKGNKLGFKYGNTAWTLAEIIGAHKRFTTGSILLEAFAEYVEWNNTNPWKKNELVKGGDLAGIVIQVDTIRPLSLGGMCGFLGMTSSWWKELRKRCEKSEKSADREYMSAIRTIEDSIYNQKYEGAMVGAFNSNIAVRDLGLVDKQAVQVNDDREKAADVFPFEDDKERLKKKSEK